MSFFKIVCLACALFISVPTYAEEAPATNFSLTSSDFKDGDVLDKRFEFNGFGCTGENKAPVMWFGGAPENTKYFALTMYDPDAPTGSGWWHWVVINIPATEHKLDVKALPDGAIETHTDYGVSGFGGACPPMGDKPHHYIFTLYALKDKIPLEANVPAAQIGFYIHNLKIAEAKMTATYGR